jgi:predicted ATPase
VLDGNRRVIFVSGEAGIGKSAFVQKFLDSITAEGVTRVAQGQCVEHFGAGEPYMPVLEALSRLGRGPGGERVVENLSRFAPMWLAQMPGLLNSEERAHLQSQLQGVTQQRMLREISDALEALTVDAPLLISLEDLHWSDFSTLELISAVARREVSMRLMVLATYRPVEVSFQFHPLRTMKQELELHHYCEDLKLKLLSQKDVADYLSERFPSDSVKEFTALAQVIYARSDGNPLFMVNVVDYLLGKSGLAMRSHESSNLTAITDSLDPPHSLRAMIERNLERLQPEEQVILEGASVAGTEFSAASVAAALNQPGCSRLPEP